MASRPRTPKPTPAAEVPEAAMAITLPPEVSEKLEAIEVAAQVARVTPLAEAKVINPPPEPDFTVVVTGPKAGRRRAGRAFGPEPVSIPAAALTEHEIAALQADPFLTVELVDAPY